MRRRVLLMVLAVIVLGGGVAGALYWRWYHSPRYALQQMVLALQTKQMDRFFNYLDLKAIFNNFLEASSHDLEVPENNKGGDDLSRLLSHQWGRKFAQQLLPKLFDLFEKKLRETLASQLLKLDQTEILGLGAAVTMAQIEVRGENAAVTLQDPKTQEPLRFQMRRQDKGVWRIVALNYQDFKRLAKRELKR
jgi:hypothetical protein